MIRNFLKIAVRNLLRYKTYSMVNIAGLALSMTCGILIFSLVSYHLNFDDFHADKDRIYRFVTEQHRDQISYVPSVPGPLGKAFRNDYTFGEQVARIATFDEQLITVEGKNGPQKFMEAEGVAFTEPEFFQIFNYPLTEGHMATALSEPNTAVITERVAEKLFGKESAIGKSFKIDNRLIARVTGILKDLPANTDRRTGIYVSFTTLKDYNSWLYSDDSWGGIASSMQCFVKLKPGINPAEVERVLPEYVKKYRPKNKNVHHYKLQPLEDIHFNARYNGVMDKKNLWVLSLTGIFLIITACVNFINMATAQALRRSKEVGVRKVLGGVKAQLFGQFMTETALITIISGLMAWFLAVLLLPTANDWAGARMTLYGTNVWQLPVFMLSMGLVITVLSGSYPGMILAGFQPVKALKGRLSQQQIGGFNTRRVLIISQFAISQVLLIGMIVITRQMNYAQNSDLGFRRDAIVLIPAGADSTGIRKKSLLREIASVAGVEHVSLCSNPPSSHSVWNTSVNYDRRAEAENFQVSMKFGDDHYVPLFGLELVTGRNLLPSDTTKEFVVNDSFVKKLNLASPEEVIGKELSTNGGSIKGQIVGVVRDFHEASFHSEIGAVALSSDLRSHEILAVHLNPRSVKPALTEIAGIWNRANPELIYEYAFLDDTIRLFYETEETMLSMIRVFSFLAIFIGCLGLYGMISFMVNQKTKEIGIRKVLGGNIAHILWIFMREFCGLVALAFMLAAPLGWWLMSRWLSDFDFKIPLSPWFFVMAFLFTLLIALVTTGWQAFRAATVNPVKSLKSE